MGVIHREDEQGALRAEVVVFGLLAGSFILYNAPLASLLGPILATGIVLVYLALWMAFAVRTIGRLQRH